MKEIVCTKYNSTCTLSAESCAKRYQKATFNPGDGSLDPCRKCDDGKRNFEIWKKSFTEGQEENKEKFPGHPVIAKKPYKCRFCETPTVSAERICLKCQIEGKKDKDEGRRMKDENCRGEVSSPDKEKEEVMGTKICKKCGTPASSNAQPDCKSCGEVFSEKAGKLKAQVSRERAPRHTKEAPAMPQGKIGPDGGRESEPGNYMINVDFSRYPKLHERLIRMADEDIRNPGDQLLYMLKNTLGEMEARV